MEIRIQAQLNPLRLTVAANNVAEALDEAVALLSAECMPQTPDFILPTARLILEEYHRMTLTNKGPDSLSRVQDVTVSEE